MVDHVRRRLLTGSLGAMAVVMLGGCDSDDGTAPPDPTTTSGALAAGDIDLLAATAQLERALAQSYRSLAAARPGELAAAGLTERVALHLDHHDAHGRTLDLLTGPVESMPTLPGLVVPSDDDVTELPVAQLVDSLRHLEEVLAGTYVDAVARLSTPAMRQVAAGIAAAEAGHAVGLGLALGGIGAYDPAAAAGGLYPVARSAFQG